MPNRLINETSPYLLQHAENPVDWFPWGPEALELAKTKDKPILLSVGYSACHWCHVMERESFENYDIATLMNENFINIKVDREERPDVDSIYMTAIQAMTGSGGWPMTVFLTPEGKPFYGGTYFPPEDRRGMPGLPKILTAISAAYQQNRSEVANTTKQLMDQCIQFSTSVPSREPLNENIMDVSYTNLYKQFDTTYGGIGMQPKFPQPMTYEFLLRHYIQTGDQKSLNMVELTLEKMANGGIYDQLGGGFHRYSTDIYWLVPHFEKMLYDNALLVRLYLHAYQITRKEKYKTVVEETLDYVTREMTDSNGGFHSAQDADSDGVEGQFFVWRPDEIIKILGKSKGELINEYYSITDIGNFEGKNILTTKTDLETFAKKSLKNKHELIQLIEFSKSKLLDSRNLRVKPLRDEKIIAAWNGLMLAAFAEAGSVLKNPTYITIAETNASFLLDNLCVNGRILRSFKDGKAHLNGYLEDYAFLISGLILLHEATSNDRWILEAIRLGDSMLDLFWDEKTGQLYDTGKDHDKLIFRPRDISDNAIPSGNSMATDVLLKLALITGNSALKTVATTTLKCSIDLMSRFPSGAGHWLCTLDFYLSATKEIVIRGKRGDANTESLYDEVYRNFIPNRIVLGTENPDAELSALPLIQQSIGSNVQPVAYVCQNYTCKFPSHHPDTMREQLGQSM